MVARQRRLSVDPVGRRTTRRSRVRGDAAFARASGAASQATRCCTCCCAAVIIAVARVWAPVRMAAPARHRRVIGGISGRRARPRSPARCTLLPPAWRHFSACARWASFSTCSSSGSSSTRADSQERPRDDPSRTPASSCVPAKLGALHLCAPRRAACRSRCLRCSSACRCRCGLSGPGEDSDGPQDQPHAHGRARADVRGGRRCDGLVPAGAGRRHRAITSSQAGPSSLQSSSWRTSGAVVPLIRRVPVVFGARFRCRAEPRGHSRRALASGDHGTSAFRNLRRFFRRVIPSTAGWWPVQHRLEDLVAVLFLPAFCYGHANRGRPSAGGTTGCAPSS